MFPWGFSVCRFQLSVFEFSFSQNVTIHLLFSLSLWVYNTLFLYGPLKKDGEESKISAILYSKYSFTAICSSFKFLVEITFTLEILITMKQKIVISSWKSSLCSSSWWIHFFFIFEPIYLLTLWLYWFWRNFFHNYIDPLCLCLTFIHGMGINAHKTGNYTVLTKLTNLFEFCLWAWSVKWGFLSLVSLYSQMFKTHKKCAIFTVFLFSFWLFVPTTLKT